jgi:CheY-like chemotaxis protein
MKDDRQDRPTGTDPTPDALSLYDHDIRAAVSDILGAVRLVEADRLDPETRQQIERVRAAGDSLAALVDAALSAAAGEALILSPQDGTPLAELIDSWRRRWKGRASELGLRFSVVEGENLPERVPTPRMALERIVGNLLGNALIHSGGSEVRLILSRTPEGELCIDVADEGPGPEDGDAPAPRGAGEGPAPAGRGGHGLGLRIVEDLSTQIGARLHRARGGPLNGSVIGLTLPIDRDAGSGQATAQAKDALPPPDLSGLRILVAEDNRTNRLILRQMLEGMGAAPVFAEDGAEALAALDEADFDIGLIDIEMPRVSGLEAMRAMRRRADAAAGMPLVALTAYVLRDNREAIYAAGADGIIGKPVSSAEEFGRAILRYAGRPTGQPEPEDVLAGHTTDDALFGVRMDDAKLDDLLAVAGPEGARELLARLAEDLSAVREGLDAGVADRSVAMIREKTHILIAISGSVGAERLCRLAEVLNISAKRKRLDDLAALYAPCRRDLDDLLANIARRTEEASGAD